MDREQIEKWRAEADAHANTIHPLLPEYPHPRLSAILNWQRDHRAAGDDHFARSVRNAALAEAKEAVRPKSPRPCMCDRCTCGNQSDAEACAAWDATKHSEIAIDALAEKEPQP